MGGPGTIPPEAWDPTHPDHTWWAEGGGCRATKPCPKCDAPVFGPAVTRDELAMDLDPCAFLGDRASRQARARRRADRLLAKYAVHHLPERSSTDG